MPNLQSLPMNKFTDKGSERIRIILEEAKNTLVDEGFSDCRLGLLPNELG